MKVELEARNLEQKSEAEKIGKKLDGQSFIGVATGGRKRAALWLGIAA